MLVFKHKVYESGSGRSRVTPGMFCVKNFPAVSGHRLSDVMFNPNLEREPRLIDNLCEFLVIHVRAVNKGR